MNYQDSLPPQNIELEESILARLIIHPEDMDVAVDNIHESDFYRTAHGVIYGAIKSLYHTNTKYDLAIIAEKLRADEKLESIGGASFLSKLLDCPMAISVEHTCRKIAEKAALRKLIAVSNTYVQKAFQDAGNAEDLIDQFQTEITKIKIDGGDDEVDRVDTLMYSYVDALEKMAQKNEKVTGHNTGFRLLDYITCGWQDSDLIIIAARPSMGKTALAFRFALNMGKQGIPGLIFSLEMSKRQCVMRMAAMESGINIQKFRNGRLESGDWSLLNNAASRISEMPIFIMDKPSLHYNKIRRISRKRYKTDGIRYVFVDHLQLAKGDYPKDPFNDTGSITGPMKALAKELEMPVFVLSQLNRDLEKRKDKRPIMADLRNSGNIEQDADIVMFIYRDEYYSKEHSNEPGIAQVNVAKQRNGPPGMVKMFWKDTSADFAELTPDGQYGDPVA